MGTRIELQGKLEQLLGSSQVYYQPPEEVKMSYPAIRYSKIGMDKVYADNGAYRLRTRYSLTVIDRRPDNPVIQKLLVLPYCSYDRHYISNNLNHDALTIYF
jgi:hypothetical protein